MRREFGAPPSDGFMVCGSRRLKWVIMAIVGHVDRRMLDRYGHKSGYRSSISKQYSE
ncbi:MAG: hypothetical protein HY231_23595 [Acidobacteria bacterium]|nr:hypothetical protein [Acidobacteriota bacterium]